MDASMQDDLVGICDSCAITGIADMPCPECGKPMISLGGEKPIKPTDSSDEDLDDDGRYKPEDLESVSFEDLAEEEAVAEDGGDETL